MLQKNSKTPNKMNFPTWVDNVIVTVLACVNQ